MNILIGTVLIGAAALWLFLRLPNADWRAAALRATAATLKFTAPRVIVALLGAGFFAELLPADTVRAVFGAEAGARGLLLAIAIAPITPGGAFVSFAVAAAALKVGAAPPMAIAYVTSWAVYSLMKIVAYELPFMGPRTTLIRLAVSWPVPVVVAGGAWAVF